MRRIPLLHSWLFAVGSAIAVFVIEMVALKRGSVVGDYVVFAYFALYGAYCTANYVSCREVHCGITGPGFLAPALLMLLRISGLLDFGYGLPWLVFVGAAVIGQCVEHDARSRRGSPYRR
jgi:hypothetical protein